MRRYLVEITIVKFVRTVVKAKTERQAEAMAKKKVFAKKWTIGRKDIESPNVIDHD